MRGPFRGNTMMIIFLVIMVVNSIRMGRFNDPAQWLMNTLLLLPAIVIAITFHEFMHAYSAYKLGDMTPKAQGRVTLNPISHIDPVGIIVLIFVGFGWGRPVQVNPYAFKKNRRAANLVVDVAGVAMNFVIAFVVTAIRIIAILHFGLVPNGVLDTILNNIILINFILMIFNLLPIPPLDGFGIITEIFDLRRFSWYRPLYDNGFFILLILIIFGLLGRILQPAMAFFYNFSHTVWLNILL